jgi:hypothetical protein
MENALKANELRELYIGMRNAYARGENVMGWARNTFGLRTNTTLISSIAYDLQAGTYVQHARENAEFRKLWCAQVAKLIEPLLGPNQTIMEVGVGEATTLSGVISHLPMLMRDGAGTFGFDISWSRLAVAKEWLSGVNVDKCNLFVADLFSLPLADNSVDIVYTSHSLEPNGGRESAAIAECARVASKYLVLVEPIYELASPAAKERMESHGYVRRLRETAERLGLEVVHFELLQHTANPLNPSGVLILKKRQSQTELGWKCPITAVPLTDKGDCYYGGQSGIAYPVLRGIPVLTKDAAILASKLG